MGGGGGVAVRMPKFSVFFCNYFLYLNNQKWYETYDLK